MENDDVISGIRDRMARCRRLASEIDDAYAKQELLKMAEEGEEAVRRMEAEQPGMSTTPSPEG
jgi:hypothetical protein